jgi:hypothetical protein
VRGHVPLVLLSSSTVRAQVTTLEEDLEANEGPGYVEIGGLAQSEDVERAPSHYDELASPAALDGHVDDDSVRDWKRQASSGRIV